jgi:hypothetical protein
LDSIAGLLGTDDGGADCSSARLVCKELSHAVSQAVDELVLYPGDLPAEAWAKFPSASALRVRHESCRLHMGVEDFYPVCLFHKALKAALSCAPSRLTTLVCEGVCRTVEGEVALQARAEAEVSAILGGRFSQTLRRLDLSCTMVPLPLVLQLLGVGAAAVVCTALCHLLCQPRHLPCGGPVPNRGD